MSLKQSWVLKPEWSQCSHCVLQILLWWRIKLDWDLISFVFFATSFTFCLLRGTTAITLVAILKAFILVLLLIYRTLKIFIQFSHPVMSTSLWPNGVQHARPPCPSPTLRAWLNSSQLSRWYHPTITSSGVPFSSCLQSFPASGSFQMRQFYASGAQSIGASASASVLPMNIEDWFPLGLTGWITLQSKGLSRVFSNTTVQDINSLALSFLYSPTLTSIHDNWKNHTFDRWAYLGK